MSTIDRERVILVVEDNPTDEALMVRALEKSDILNPIVVARDGAEALDYLFARGAHAQRAPGEIQVVLVDLKLPKIDGLEVLRAMRLDERTKLLPVVVLTSSVEEQDMIRSFSLGANSYVRKPVDFLQFSEAVRQLGLYWLVLNEAPPVAGAPGAAATTGGAPFALCGSSASASCKTSCVRRIAVLVDVS